MDQALCGSLLDKKCNEMLVWFKGQKFRKKLAVKIFDSKIAVFLLVNFYRLIPNVGIYFLYFGI